MSRGEEVGRGSEHGTDAALRQAFQVRDGGGKFFVVGEPSDSGTAKHPGAWEPRGELELKVSGQRDFGAS